MHMLPFMAILGLCLAVGVGGTMILKGELPWRRDLREPTYLRTSGPVQVVFQRGAYTLRLADRAFAPTRSPATACLAKLNWAIVDHCRHSHTILGVWDRTGANVFLFPGYQPDPPLPPRL
jgi:hypothetical protein